MLLRKITWWTIIRVVVFVLMWGLISEQQGCFSFIIFHPAISSYYPALLLLASPADDFSSSSSFRIRRAATGTVAAAVVPFAARRKRLLSTSSVGANGENLGGLPRDGEEEDEESGLQEVGVVVDGHNDEEEEFILKDDDADNIDEHSENDMLAISLEDLKTAFATNVSYFYLQHELGLSEDAMWRITFEASSALGMTAKTIRHKVDVLRQGMNLTDSEIRSLLEQQPSLLHLSADENIRPTLKLLANSLHLTTDQLRQLVLSSPSILTYREATLRAKIRFFTRALGFSIDETRQLFYAEPKLLRAGVKTGLEPHLQFFLKELDFERQDIRRIVQKNPRILLYSLDNNLIPKLVFYLILTLHMEPPQVRRLLISYPDFVDFNLENHLLPMSRYFTQDLTYSLNELHAMLLKFPRLVTYSLRKIKYVVGFFRYQISMTASQVKRLLYQAPQVIGLSQANIEERITFFRESFGKDGLTEDELKQILAGMPTLLVLSIPNNLEPKRDYLLQAFDNDMQAVKEAVLKLPTLLGYSLDKRIRPRMEAILQAGLEPSRITVGIPMKQDKFERWLQRRDAANQKAQRQRALVFVPNKKVESSSDRIMHWTRERRPPKQKFS